MYRERKCLGHRSVNRTELSSIGRHDTFKSSILKPHRDWLASLHKVNFKKATWPRSPYMVRVRLGCQATGWDSLWLDCFAALSTPITNLCTYIVDFFTSAVYGRDHFQHDDTKHGRFARSSVYVWARWKFARFRRFKGPSAITTLAASWVATYLIVFWHF